MGQTPLMWAAAGGHAEITKLLLDHGADISPKTPGFGRPRPQYLQNL